MLDQCAGNEEGSWDTIHLHVNEVLIESRDQAAAIALVQLLVHGAVAIHANQLGGIQHREEPLCRNAAASTLFCHTRHTHLRFTRARAHTLAVLART